MAKVQHKDLTKLNQVDRLIIANWIRKVADAVENGEIDEISVEIDKGYPGARHL